MVAGAGSARGWSGEGLARHVLEETCGLSVWAGFGF